MNMLTGHSRVGGDLGYVASGLVAANGHVVRTPFESDGPLSLSRFEFEQDLSPKGL